MKNRFPPELELPVDGTGLLSDVFEQVGDDESLRGPVEEDHLPNEPIAPDQHLVDLSGPRVWRGVGQKPIELEVGLLALYAGTDPNRRFGERFLPRGNVEVVIASGRDQMCDRTDVMDPSEEPLIDGRRRVDEQLAVRQPNHRGSCVKIQAGVVNGVLLEPDAIRNQLFERGVRRCGHDGSFV